ncbi:TetR/AcrR family transcriptional regulator [Primorskyibacter sp. S187A]|uniref:TetR/AcrR family transcriptional regulator n=1 Tax=Primorskyibacter sp. S187A TaxID=3415130 RepID=UPI003C7A9F9A
MKKRRFKKDDWLRHGLTQLSEKGPEAVKLEAICASAGLTRGSFYHHFEDHDSYLHAVARMWLEEQTHAVAREMEADSSADAQSEALTEAAMGIDYRLELGIRELARRLPPVAKIVTQADQLRLGILSDLYARRFGLEPARAEALAFLEYAAFSGLILLEPDMPRARQMALAELYDTTIATALGKGD